MKSTRQFLSHLQWALVPLFLLLAQQVWSQCTNPSAFGTVTAPTNNTPVTITTCAFAGEYSTINSCTAGSTYLFTGSGGTGNYLTVHQGTPGGTVLGFGFSPISVTCTASGPLYLHYNTNAACGTESVCHTGTVQCTSCAGASDPCSTPTTASCGTSYTATVSGAGLYSPGSCGFSTPGGEKVYSFTAPTTGTYTLQVTSTSATGYIDYFYKAASGGCSGTGWTCILDIFSPTTATIGTLTAGTTYYIMLDAETTSSVTHTFQINCPSFNPCASIPTMVCATPVTASTSGTGAWSPASCGFSTPGTEQLYSFTPTTTGNHTLVITATNSVYADYFYKVASGGCNATGWTCIGDAFSPESNTFGPLTAGTTYYILYDPESTSLTTQTFRIDCPSAGSAPSCISSPTSPTNGQTNICPTATQTLSWPIASGATGYDVYFGTSPTPPFVGTTASTSFVVNTPTSSVYYWQIRPNNAFGTASGCTVWNFSKIDIQAPTITCPASVSVNNNPATACSAVATYGSISGTDNCSAPSLALIGGLPSGSTFPVGVNVVTYRATDAAGLTATCSFTVTVKDVTLPTITCPANVVANNDPNLCGAVRTYAAPVATDNCGIQSVTLISGLASGSFFPVGTTTNVYRATDVNTNSSTCSFTVKINDVQPPTANCPPPITKPNDFGQCGRNISYLGSLTFQDNCGVFNTSNNSPGFFPIGTTTVTYTVGDAANNTGTCQMTVTIYDYEYPTLVCPPNITTQTDEFDCVATVNYNVTANDNCPGVVLEYSTEPNSTFNLGYTNVTATATDAAGNSWNCTFQIKVNPREELCNGYDDDCDGYTDEAEDWKKVAKRIAKDGAAFDEYGISVDIDGEWAVVGSNKKNSNGQTLGSAYLLHRVDGQWTGILRLLPDQLPAGTQFGNAVAIDNDIVAVGAPSDDDMAGNAGAVYIYQQSASNPNSWVQVKKLFAGDAAQGDNFGAALSLDGNWLLAGAPLRDGTGADAGSAYVFGRNTGGADNWGQAAQLNAADGEAGDNLGHSVAISGNNAVVGAPGDDDNGQDAGAAYRFNRNQGGADNWGQVSKLHGAQTLAGDKFGWSVAASGALALIGAPYNDQQGSDAGCAFGFNSIGQTSLVLNPSGAAGDHFGASVAIDGDYAVVGAPGDDPFGEGSGKGFVFLLVDQGWALVGQLSDGAGGSGDALGTSAAMSERTVLMGAPFDQYGSAAGRGSVSFFEGLCSDAAARPRTDNETNVTMKGLDVQVFPVPFSETLNIQVNTEAGDVRITVLNTLGQEIATLNEGQGVAGGRYEWQAGKAQPGLYFVRVEAGNLIQTKAVVLARN